MSFSGNAAAPHLSDADLAAVLEGEPSATAAAHLASCRSCTAELAGLREALSSFRRASIHLAADQPLFFSRPVAATRVVTSHARLAWGMSLATAVVVAGALLHPHHPEVVPTANPAVQAQVETQSAEADKALMQNIDSDLSAPYPPSLDPLANPNSSN